MDTYFIRHLAVIGAAIACSPLAMAYTGSECTMAHDLADTGIIYEESDCRDYSLDRTIYRQEVAALALRVAEKCDRIDNIPEIDDYNCDNLFYDVTASRPNTWACRSVEILAENDIITTSRRDTLGRAFFQPMKDITKSEALSMIMDSAGFEFRGERYDDWRFTGTGAVSWQKPVMQYAEDNDIIPSISSFKPNTIAYRREVFAYAQRSIEHCENGDNGNSNDNNNNNDTDNLSITTDDASPDINDWIDLTVKAREGSSTDTSYEGDVEFEVYYRVSSSSSWIKTTSSSYYEIDNDYDDGYSFTSSNKGQKTLNNFIRFKKDDYSYKVVVTDEDDDDIEGYKIFTVGDTGSSSGDTDNFYITTDDASPGINNFVDLTIRSRDGSSTDTSYEGDVEFEVYYRASSSSSWIKTTSSSYYEIDNDYDDGYSFTTANRGQKTLANFIRFKKDNYEYKVVVADEDDDDIEGYKTFTVGDYNDNSNECGLGEYESGDNCYSCNGRPSNAYYEEEGTCDWTCNSGYVERNGKCENNSQTCGIGQYLSGSSCYSCTTKPSSASYSNYGTCDWSCNSGYYRDGNTCVSNTQNCSIGQYSNGSTCQSCVSGPSNSYYTSAGSCSWSCNANYYSSGSQCVPYTQNCGVGQYTSGNICVNCSGKPSNSIYAQTGTCDWTCDYGYTRDGSSCVQTQNYSWYTGSWNTCNATCGGGTKTRIVECRSNIGYVVNNWQCTGTMPTTSQTCNTQACDITTFDWKIGNWGTCQNNVQDRTILCERNDGVIVANSSCNSSTKPATTQSCNSTTYSWVSGSWGTCSSDQQIRNVTCQNSSGQTVANSNCNSGTKPATTQSCNSFSYDWKIGNWGTCQNNIQDRTILCERDDGVIVANSSCNSGTKPSSSQSCTSTTYSWVSGSWGTCSINQQTRNVICQNSSGQTVANSSCNSGTKPATTQSCNNFSYDWKIGNWGTCQNNVQDRTILCERDDGVIVANTYCNAGNKPSTSQSCNSWTYDWYASNNDWGTCTNGSQTRPVTCRRSDGTSVSNTYCNAGTKPTTTQSCTSYVWYRGDASTCGTTCNTTRDVVCKNTAGQVVADSYCTTTRPGHVCSRALAWVDTDSTKSCNTVCNQNNSCWVEDSQAQACASGEREPTWGTFNFLFGKIANPTQLGGFYIYERENRFYCYGKTQTRDYQVTDKVVACLCQ